MLALLQWDTWEICTAQHSLSVAVRTFPEMIRYYEGCDIINGLIHYKIQTLTGYWEMVELWNVGLIRGACSLGSGLWQEYHGFVSFFLYLSVSASCYPEMGSSPLPHSSTFFCLAIGLETMQWDDYGLCLWNYKPK